MPTFDALRRDAIHIFQAGITAADPYQAVKRCLSVNNQKLAILLDNGSYRIGNWPKIYLLAFGKAACAMAKAAQSAIPSELLANTGIVVTNYENEKILENMHVIGAGHPLPDIAGHAAAQELAKQLNRAQQGDLVLVLISGGGSALVPYPATGISLQEKIAVTDLLLACGATINETNCVRKHLSQIKGGGLAKMAAPADLHALILSDVLGDDLSTIASGPTVPDNTSYHDAATILKSYGIWDKTPPTVRQHIGQGIKGLIPETPKADDPIFLNTGHTLVGSNAISVAAMLASAKQLGYQTHIYSQHLCGEAKTVAEQLANHAKQIRRPLALLAGGETTVTLTGTGRGGRNQELALAFALAAEQQGLNGTWAFLSGGTDGRDGPTDAAGGLVDNNSLMRMRASGCEPIALLANNDSYHALKNSADLLDTGATGTNVADLQILLINP